MMKKLLASTMLALLMITTGCHTTQPSAKILVSTVYTVDAAMQGWHAYAVRTPVTADQDNAVRAAYEKYQMAENLAETAYVAAAKANDPSIYNNAASVLRASSDSLLALINSFIKK